MTPEVFIRYIRFLHDQFILNKALSGVISSFRVNVPQPPGVRQAGTASKQKQAQAGSADASIPSAGLRSTVLTLQQLMQPLFSASQEEKEVLQGFGVLKYANLGFYEMLLQKVEAKPNEAETEWLNATRELNVFLTRLTQLFTLLNIFNFKSLTVPDGQADLEVVFEGEAAIDDVVGASDWFGKWYFIIDGYSRLLDKHKEDFKFVQLSKASPTRLRIRGTLQDVAAIATILALLLQMEQRFAERRVVIEQMKKVTLVSPEADAEHIKRAEESLKDEIDKELESLANDRVTAHKVVENGETNFVAKAIKEQHNFIVHGGQVNVYLPNDANEDSKLLIQTIRQEALKLREIEERLKVMQRASQKGIE